jgi:hypothetical protein
MSVANVLPNGNPTYDCNGTNTYPIYITKYGDTTYNWGKRLAPPDMFTRAWPGGKQPTPPKRQLSRVFRKSNQISPEASLGALGFICGPSHPLTKPTRRRNFTMDRTG